MLAVAAFLQTDQRSLMGATIDHRVDIAVRVAGYDDGDLADEGGLEVALVRNVDLEAQEIPNGGAEDSLMLQCIDIRVRVEPVGDARDASFRPLEGIVEWFGSDFGHGRRP